MRVLGDLLLTGTPNGYLIITSIETGEELFSQKMHSGALRNIDVLQKNQLITSGDDGKIFKYDLSTL